MSLYSSQAHLAFEQCTDLYLVTAQFSIPADVLAHRLGTQVKELAALAAKLLEDKLLCTFRRNETKDSVHNRTFQRTYYYLDFKLFLDVTKWRMTSIRKKIDQRLRNELDNKGYVCPRCKRSYSTLEVAHILDPFRNVFVCESPGCGTELVDNEEAEDVKKSKDSLMRFNEQLGTILSGLRQLEGITLPPLDVGAWLAKHAASQPWNIRRDDDVSNPSPSISLNGVAPGLQVDLTSNDPAAEAARLRAKQKAEEEQRKQNALPSWHLASTVSGEQTSLGKKQERLENQKGFDFEEKKNEDEGDDADYYAQYASLQDAEKAANAPSASHEAEQANSFGALEEDFEGDFEEVDTNVTSDVKRKRSPSPTTASKVSAKRAKEEPAPVDDDEDGLDDFEDVV